MARIRSIKPELLEDERTARLSHVEWRLFVSLLLLSDDYGNLRAAPERIHGAALWAHPREDLANALDGLAGAGLVVLYVVDDQKYAHINGWEKHQKVDHPGRPLCPGVSEGSRIPRESFAKVREGLAPDQDQDQDQEQDQERADSREAREKLAPVWPAHDWLKRFGRSWTQRYEQLAYGQPGDSKACSTLNDMLERLAPADRLAAQGKARGMFDEFLSRADQRTVERRHPFAFFVHEWGGLRAPRKTADSPGRARSRSDGNLDALSDWEPPQEKTA